MLPPERRDIKHTPLTKPQTEAGRGKEPPTKEELQERVTQLENCLRAFNGELLEGLKAIPDPDNSWVNKGLTVEKDFTVGQLIEDVENMTPRGLEHLRLWGNAQQTLRKLGKK